MKTRPQPPHRFAGLPPARSGPGAPVTVLPVPYEATTCYRRGTRGAPAAILAASAQVELYDEETGVDIEAIGIHTAPALAPGEAPAEAVRAIRNETARRVARGAFVVTLGGEHAVTVGAAAGHASRHPGMGVLVLDAHADLRDRYEGTPWSHACASRRLSESFPVSVAGVRSVSAECMAYAAAGGARLWPMHLLRARRDWIRAVVDALPPSVYVSIDADALDPAVIPGVGTPEPGGLSWAEATALLKAVAASRRVVGFDLVEVLPEADRVLSEYAAARLILKFLSYLAREGQIRSIAD